MPKTGEMLKILKSLEKNKGKVLKTGEMLKMLKMLNCLGEIDPPP